MPKHVFKFPEVVIESVKTHVRNAIRGLDPLRYQQEANYTAALLGRMEGFAYEGRHGSVLLKFSPFNDRGPGSAESRFGADHAITAIVSDGTITISKAILVQAKLGEIVRLTPSERSNLNIQIENMKQLVNSPKVLQIVERRGQRYPEMISGTKILQGLPFRAVPLDEYFTSRVTTTLDGCTDPVVVGRVQNSALPTLQVVAKLRD